MKLRRKKTKTARQRQRSAPSDSNRSSAFSYGANRPDQESIANRETQREKTTKTSK